MRRLFFLLSVILLFAGCGDWGTDGPSHGSGTYMHFHYYYGQDCSYVANAYVCGDAYALSRPLDVSVTVHWNGDADVYYNGSGPYSYWDGDYVYDYDPLYGEFYYQFNLTGGYVLTVYDLRGEAIYADTFAGVEYHYFSDFR